MSAHTMEAPLQKYNLQQQLSDMQDAHETTKIILELLKKYFLPVHVEVLRRGYRKQTGSDLPFRDFGFPSAADFLRDGCGDAFDVTQSKTDETVFYVAPRDSASNGKSLTLKREPVGKIPSEPDPMRRVLQMLNNGNAPIPRKKKSVPPQFRQYLRFLMSRHASGITAEGLVTEFLRVSGSPLSYEMYGYPSHMEMFRDLSDVFTIRQQNGESILYPSSVLDKTISPLKSPSKTFLKPIPTPIHEPKLFPCENSLKSTLTPVVEPKRSSPSSVRAKAGRSTENVRFHDVGKIELESGGSLVYVKLNGHHYIPTPCLASLAGQPSDSILRTLEDHHIDLQGVEVLRDSVQEHTKLRYEIALVNCPLVITKAGGLIREITLVPLKSIGTLLLVFGLRNVEFENCFKKIQESLSPC